MLHYFRNIDYDIDCGISIHPYEQKMKGKGRNVVLREL